MHPGVVFCENAACIRVACLCCRSDLEAVLQYIARSKLRLHSDQPGMPAQAKVNGTSADSCEDSEEAVGLISQDHMIAMTGDFIGPCKWCLVSIVTI